jgi:UDP-N-acetylmuramoylalanine--D-glutamate ligase
MEAYANAKKNIFRFQDGTGVLILNADDPALAGWSREAPGRVERFCLADDPFELLVPGKHNQMNAQAAWAAGKALNVDRESAAEAMGSFKGLPHRLALVAERNGVRYYDDSKATTPDSAVVALNSFAARTVIAIVGGYDKRISLEALCCQAARQCKAVVITGQVARQIAEGIRDLRGDGDLPALTVVDRFDAAVAAAVQSARPGDVVLLSPGCASYDEFPNYVARGQRFQRLLSDGGRNGQ